MFAGQSLRMICIPSVLFLFLIIPTAAVADTYLYDNHNRLYRVNDGLVTMQFEYDDAGNRISISSTVGDYGFDGVLDVVENAGCTDYMDGDSDDDGISDGVEDLNHNGVVDSGETDPCNIDSDNDGIQDGTELGYVSGDSLDTADKFQPDLDPTTTTNPLSADSDNDWISDGAEDANYNGRVDSGESDPLDQDITDTDNDGLFDALENQTCTEVNNPDTDGDTLLDGIEDSNHNGYKDNGETSPCNEDTDGDGLSDDVDPNPTGNIDAIRTLVPAVYLPLLLNNE
jgi:YD repeat-containing protein